ncbi:MAG: ABC transporter ATP-binding protein [Burkholderiaceae bacterium]|jgi:simple sugar transport system ATP-binding protein|nr:ABC transporter ATP-binding protein [Burkholderiaceae bacterium]
MPPDRTAPRLQLTGITKRYAGRVACENVALTVQPGEIHAVLGENGAGKSTLMQIVHGLVRPDAGEVCLDGQPVRIGSPRQARRLGVEMVFQHPQLFESLSVAENVWLGLDGAPPLVALTRRIARSAADWGLDVEPARPVHTLDQSGRQQVEIVRALLAVPRLLMLDEPTAVLTPAAAQRLFTALRQLAASGCGILYISHKLDEIGALCHTCTVLRAGRVAGVCDPRAHSSAALARLMMGGEPPTPAPVRRECTPGPVVLQVGQLDLPRASPFGVDLRGVSLRVRAGEVVGIAGISGNGQRELLAALSGEDRRASAASISIAGQPAGDLPSQHRRALGLRFVPAERLGRGAAPALSLAHNLLLTRQESVGPLGWLRMAALRRQTRTIIDGYGVQAAGTDAPARSLSGGNLQKYVMGREIDAAPKLLIAAQPTWGLDVGAAARIHAELLALRDAGCAVLLASDDLDELLALCDRLHVMAAGQMSPSMPREHANAEHIGAWMSGRWDGAAKQQDTPRMVAIDAVF